MAGEDPEEKRKRKLEERAAMKRRIAELERELELS